MKKLLCCALALLLLTACGVPAADPTPTPAPTPTAEVTPTPAEPTDPSVLTAEELRWFNQKFFNCMEGDVPTFRNLFAGALNVYAAPEDVNLHEVFYDGPRPSKCVYASEEEIAILKNQGAFPAEFNELLGKDGDYICPIYRVTADEMDQILPQYIGLTLEETSKAGLDELPYLEEYDAYYWCHGDMGYPNIKILRGVREGDLVRLYQNNSLDGPYCTTLRLQSDGSYLFVSNLPAGIASAGVARLCRPISENQYLLLYGTPTQKEKKGFDTFYLYDEKAGTFQALAAGEGLWEGMDYRLSVTDGHILYQTSSDRLFSIPLSGKGELSQLTKSQWDPYAISPDGSKYAVRQSGGVKVYDLQQDTLLARVEGVTDVLSMEWSPDSSQVAMVTGGGTAVTVWNTDTGDTFVCDAQNEHTPEGVVDILRAYVVDDGPVLLIDYLCETGVAFVFWDMAEDRFLDRIEVTGDAAILDILGGRVLYEAVPEDGPHTLNSYRYALKETTVLDRYEGFYTAGCLCGEGDQALAFRYDPKTKTGNLVRVP